MKRYGQTRLSRIPSLKRQMRYCYCFICKGYQNTQKNNRLKKCNCEPMKRFYAPHQWIAYCNEYNLNYDNGKKIKSP
jgi:hypothetical protein